MPSSGSHTGLVGGGGGPSALAAASAHGSPRLAYASVVEGSSPFEPGLCRHPGWARQQYQGPTPATKSAALGCLVVGPCGTEGGLT